MDGFLVQFNPGPHLVCKSAEISQFGRKLNKEGHKQGREDLGRSAEERRLRMEVLKIESRDEQRVSDRAMSQRALRRLKRLLRLLKRLFTSAFVHCADRLIPASAPHSLTIGNQGCCESSRALK